MSLLVHSFFSWPEHRWYGNPDDVLDVIEEAAFRPMDLHFEGLEHFRDMYFARIADSPALNSYVRRLRRALSDAGIPFDKKKFRPHITLVRKVSFADGQLSDVPKEFAIDINAEKASLMSSVRGKKALKLLASDGMLVKRPLLITDDKVLTGFKEDDWKEALL